MSAPTLSKRDIVDFAKIGDTRFQKWKALEKRLDMTRWELGRCAKCDVVTDQCCTKCFLTHYCCEEHLNQDQEKHSKICGKQLGYQLTTGEHEKGKGKHGFPHLVFTEDKRQGTVLLIEDPIVALPVLPDGYDEDKERSLEGLKIICFGCNRHFYPNFQAPVTCTTCGIWLCHKSCNSFFHLKQECSVLKKFSGRNFKLYTSSMRKYIELYLDLCVLRILHYFSAAATNLHMARQYKTFLLLANTQRYKYFKKTQRDRYDGLRYLEFIKKSVEVLKFSVAYANFNRTLVNQVYKTMIIFWEDCPMGAGFINRLLFMERHFISHSYCYPNVASSVSYEGRNTLPTVTFYTVQGIFVDKPATVRMLYDFSPHRFMSLPLRMMYIKEMGLECENPTCTLCEDPSDGGTLSGSTRCPKCPTGLYVEHQPRGKDLLLDPFPKRWSHDYVNHVDWKCSNPECGDIVPFTTVLEVNKNCFDHWKEIRRNPTTSTMLVAQQFINFYENSYLHPMNGTILQAKYEYLMAIREMHFWKCELDARGNCLLPPEFSKVHSDKKIKDKLKLFPIIWDEDELKVTKCRAQYAAECRSYLEKANPKYLPHEYCEYIYLMLESAIMELLAACHHFFMELSIESADRLAQASTAAVEVVEKWTKKKIMVFHEQLIENPLLKWPEQEFNMLVAKFKYEKRPLPVALLVLKMMGITLGEFMMGEGAGAKVRADDGADDWPLSFETTLLFAQERLNKKSYNADDQKLYQITA